jgi:hypothetical protein
VDVDKYTINPPKILGKLLSQTALKDEELGRSLSIKLGTRYHIPLQFHDTVISNLSNNLAYVSA